LARPDSFSFDMKPHFSYIKTNSGVFQDIFKDRKF
jgi:hypothetical protein